VSARYHFEDESPRSRAPAAVAIGSTAVLALSVVILAVALARQKPTNDRAAAAVAPKVTSPKGQPDRPAWVGNRYEVVGYYWGGSTDHSGRVMWFVKDRPPRVGAVMSGDEYYRYSTASALAPQVRCVFDRPPSVLPLAGQRVRVTGMATYTPSPGWPVPSSPEDLEHCSAQVLGDAGD
jgi:cell division septation protein DedD